MAEPPEGTGTVFVKQLEPGLFTAIWQGDDRHAGSYVDVEGTRQEVLGWVGRCRAAAFLAFDPQRDDYVPFDVNAGQILDIPI